MQRITDEEMGRIKARLGQEKFAQSKFDRASRMFLDMMTSAEFPEFLTLVAYQEI